MESAMLWAKRVDNVAFKTLEGVVGLAKTERGGGRHSKSLG